MALTGNRRLRLQKRFLRSPVYVLQVEVIEAVTYGGPVIDIRNEIRWRDATAEDISLGAVM